MTNETTNCLVCGQPKSTSSAGSLTQWISVCQCGFLEPAIKADDNVSICASCGKRIPESNTGSFTQWVFRSQLCDCENPIPIDALQAPNRLPKSDTAGQKLSPPPSGYLSLPRETFPIERYKPIRELGAGAGGSVYLCLDQHLSRYVSVKVLNRRNDANLVAFQNEARVTARFIHPNVVGIIDFGVTAGSVPYMVLEYIDGITLDTIIKTEGAVPETAAVNLFVQVADALGHGHESGIFHRDLKSSNILVTRKAGTESVRIIDFGVSSLLGGDQETTGYQGRTIVGTPRYMPPDQVLGKVYDARSEIYSFGCMMFETLVGVAPFEADQAIDLLAQHAHQPAPRFADLVEDLNVSIDLEAVVQKCLSKNPDDRYQSMKSLSEALKQSETDQSGIDESKDQGKGGLKAVTAAQWLAAAVLLSVICLAPIVMQVMQPSSPRVLKKATATRTAKEKSHKTKFQQADMALVSSSENKFTFLPLTTQPGMFQVIQSKEAMFIVDEDLKILEGRKNVNQIILRFCDIEGPGLAYIANLPLEWLDLTGTLIDDRALSYIQRMKQLTRLDLGQCKISDQGLQNIEKLPLDFLGLKETDISMEGLKHVARIKTLKTLQLVNVKKIDASGLAQLKKTMPQVTIER